VGTDDALPSPDGVIADQLELVLPRTREAPAMARRRVAQWLTVQFDASELHKAMLLTSELVTNAVLYGQGEITLRAGLDADRLLVEVIDEGQGFERALRQEELDSIGGRGLRIVDAESSRWGIHEGTTHVWFELERPAPRLGTSSKPPA
jgi:anti-sigma regulatory factor (Ser/Thr protein kinase)